MQATFLRFILAAGAVTLYTLAAVVVWERIFDIPGLVDPTLYQWFLGTVIVCLLVSIMGGLVLVGQMHEDRTFFAGRPSIFTKRPSFFARMTFVLVALWGFQPIGQAIYGDGFSIGTLVSIILRSISVCVAALIFYFIAFKPAEAEAA